METPTTNRFTTAAADTVMCATNKHFGPTTAAFRTSFGRMSPNGGPKHMTHEDLDLRTRGGAKATTFATMECPKAGGRERG